MWIPDWALIAFLDPGPRTLLDLGHEGELGDHYTECVQLKLIELVRVCMTAFPRLASQDPLFSVFSRP